MPVIALADGNLTIPSTIYARSRRSAVRRLSTRLLVTSATLPAMRDSARDPSEGEPERYRPLVSIGHSKDLEDFDPIRNLTIEFPINQQAVGENLPGSPADGHPAFGSDKQGAVRELDLLNMRNIAN